MTRTIAWRGIALAVFTLATLTLLLATIGAPHEHGG
jgi:hypothetical protein